MGKVKNKDLEDEISVKNEELNRREKFPEKEENNSCSSLAEEFFVVHGNERHEYETKVKSFVSKIEKLVKIKAERSLWEVEKKRDKNIQNFDLNDKLCFDWKHF